MDLGKIRNASAALVFFALFAHTAYADIVGVDSRREIYSGNLTQRKLSESVALHTSISNILENKDTGDSVIVGSSLKRHKRMCKNAPFAEQPVRGRCTAFLVAPQILMTAGHCINDQPVTDPFDATPRCNNSAWVFDFQYHGASTEKVTKVVPENVYSCDQVYTVYNGLREINRGPMHDYAFIQLDRPVVGRTPLPVRSLSRRDLWEKAPVYGLGHNWGLPLKVLDSSRIHRKERNYYYTDLDVSDGASGGPVFHSTSNEIVGLIMGVLYPSGYLKKVENRKDHCRNEYRFPAGRAPTIVVDIREAVGQIKSSRTAPAWLKAFANSVR